MAPKHITLSPKRTQSSLKQSTLSFKTRKSGGIQPSKAKIKARAKAKETNREKSVSESESEVERDAIITQSSDSDDEAVNVKDLDMEDKAKLYERYYRETREKMGGLPPIHNEDQTKIHNMLRVFDNTYEYGPCIGLTRMQRWERAEAMGLNPPKEVRDILLTKQGIENPSLVHNIFHGLV